ncbi:hypothetical protein GCM10010435_94210 [Winogradskya consettensis]|uniref:Uncharacterized protein n=1 Tax=Winogradskya consettensis TaxID=113560 RepID=A0A919W1S4_9ACTN|nr:hypothetical protein Aco04nite_89760 [Actinoplanes consettensis]
MTRSRRAGLSREEVSQQPLYARLLGLQYLAPSGFLCFVFLEGAVALGILLALAELVSWWGVVVLPLTVAAMVKLNDIVAGALTTRPTIPTPATAALTSSPHRAPTPATSRNPHARESHSREPKISTPEISKPEISTPEFSAPGARSTNAGPAGFRDPAPRTATAYPSAAVTSVIDLSATSVTDTTPAEETVRLSATALSRMATPPTPEDGPTVRLHPRSDQPPAAIESTTSYGSTPSGEPTPSSGSSSGVELAVGYGSSSGTERAAGYGSSSATEPAAGYGSSSATERAAGYGSSSAIERAAEHRSGPERDQRNPGGPTSDPASKTGSGPITDFGANYRSASAGTTDTDADQGQSEAPTDGETTPPRSWGWGLPTREANQDAPARSWSKQGRSARRAAKRGSSATRSTEPTQRKVPPLGPEPTLTTLPRQLTSGRTTQPDDKEQGTPGPASPFGPGSSLDAGGPIATGWPSAPSSSDSPTSAESPGSSKSSSSRSSGSSSSSRSSGSSGSSGASGSSGGSNRDANAGSQDRKPGVDTDSSGRGDSPAEGSGKSSPAAGGDPITWSAEAVTINGTTPARQWADQLDDHQRARQSAARRYE